MTDPLRDALIKIRAHTSHNPNADATLLAGLLASIERIADAALATPPNDDTERVDALQRECDRSPDGRIILRAPPGRLREYIDNARNPKPLGGKDE